MALLRLLAMASSLQVHRLHWRYLSRVRQVYRSAFPPLEKLPFGLLRLFCLRRGIHWYVFSQEKTFLGFCYLIDYKAQTFVLYLAVDPSQRDHHYGSAILEWIKERQPARNVVLNVEPLDSNASNALQRIRRLEFYLRNGFQESGYENQDPNAVYDVLFYGPSFDPAAFQKLLSHLALHLVGPKIVKKPDPR